MLCRLVLICAGLAAWLLLAAVPVLADGGPHVSGINSGSMGLNADGCAGCHRAHTAQAPFLLAAQEQDLCLTCHGAASTGATTDVMTGIQYVSGGLGLRDSPLLGALRGGGFDQARIDSDGAFRYTQGPPGEAAHPTVYRFFKKVGVQEPADVTSAHLDLDGAGGVAARGIAWGNGSLSSSPSPGPTVSLGCTSCHNPHGNGQYRILNPVPDPATGVLVQAPPDATWPIAVTDAPLPAAGDTRNYTVIQYRGPTTADRYLLASEILADGVASTAGDYWHQVVPYNADVSDGTVANHDAPNGQPLYFNGQINAWCATCHSRYTQSTNFTRDAANAPIPGSAEVAGNQRTGVLNVDGTRSTGQPMVTPTGDAIYNYRHTTSRNRACTTCHVAHGSNAAMSGPASATVPYPDGGSAPSSRLLKVDNRGTCQLCHDPTRTTQVGDVSPTGATAPALP